MKSLELIETANERIRTSILSKKNVPVETFMAVFFSYRVIRDEVEKIRDEQRERESIEQIIRSKMREALNVYSRLD